MGRSVLFAVGLVAVFSLPANAQFWANKTGWTQTGVVSTVELYQDDVQQAQDSAQEGQTKPSGGPLTSSKPNVSVSANNGDEKAGVDKNYWHADQDSGVGVAWDYQANARYEADSSSWAKTDGWYARMESEGSAMSTASAELDLATRTGGYDVLGRLELYHDAPSTGCDDHDVNITLKASFEYSWATASWNETQGKWFVQWYYYDLTKTLQNSSEYQTGDLYFSEFSVIPHVQGGTRLEAEAFCNLSYQASAHWFQNAKDSATYTYDQGEAKATMISAVPSP